HNTSRLIDKLDVKIHNNFFTNVAYLSTVESAQRVSFLGNIVNGILHTGSNENGYCIALNYRDLIDISILGGILDGGGAYAQAIQGNVQTPNVNFDNIIVAGVTIRNFAGTAALAGIPNAVISD